MPPRIDVQSERELARGWSYVVVMHHHDHSVTRHDVSLTWPDHNYWCGGRLAPSRVVEQVLACLTRSCPTLALPSHFDLARARRWSPTIDRELVCQLGGAAA